jgi:uncharacterized protein YecT (DUF1311 family)
VSRRLAVPAMLISLAAMVHQGSAQSQREIESRTCAAYQAAEKELNDVYDAVLARYAQDREFVTKLRRSQRAWVAYRDAELAALYPSKEKQASYGSVYETCNCDARSQMIAQRIETLRQWLTGVEEGEVCAGSRRAAGL